MQTFCTVAGTLNISRAAEQLNLTQPAVSLQIKQLENLIGAPLFLRHPLRLTDVGDHLRINAQQILKQWELTLEFVQSERALTSGNLTIACSDSVMRFCLINKIKRFGQMYPGVDLSIINRTTNQATAAVVDGSADIAIAIHTGNQPKLIHKPLFSYQEVAVFHPDHDLQSQKIVTARQLCRETLLLLETNTISRNLTEQWFAHQGITEFKKMALGSVDAQAEMARIGFGVALVPDFAVPDDLCSLTIKKMATRHIATFYQRLKPAAQAWLRLVDF